MNRIRVNDRRSAVRCESASRSYDIDGARRSCACSRSSGGDSCAMSRVKVSLTLALVMQHERIDRHPNERAVQSCAACGFGQGFGNGARPCMLTPLAQPSPSGRRHYGRLSLPFRGVHGEALRWLHRCVNALEAQALSGATPVAIPCCDAGDRARDLDPLRHPIEPRQSRNRWSADVRCELLMIPRPT